MAAFFERLSALVPALPPRLDPGLPAAPWVVLAVFSALAGACIGSFLNVCIYRIPLDQSIVRPGSHCMACGSPIRWYHNIPVLSYFMLRGKCAKCGAPFSFRYAGVELLTAFLFAAVFCMWPPDGAAAPPFGIRLLPLERGAHGAMPYPPWAIPAYWVFLSGLVVGTFVDFDHFIIPDSVTKGGVAAGLVLSALVPQLQTGLSVVSDGGPGGFARVIATVPPTWQAALFRSAAGAAAGWCLVQGVRKAGTWWMRRRGRIGPEDDAMGYGDVKLAAAIGAFLGWQAVAFALVAGALAGSLVALPAVVVRRKGLLARIPFGPYLALGATVWIFWGHRLLAAYLMMAPPWRVDVFG
ncbi:MAG: prepilin peptidase [Kiritimatiellae bacterium]|nr:prepilin peptidase [Kiritimatiellia bacterium]